MNKQKIIISVALFIALLATSLNFSPETILANRIESLRNEIAKKNQELAELEKEIAEFEEKINITGAEASSLQEKISELDANRNKLLKDINLADEKIKANQLTIQRLSLEISDKQESINDHKKALARAIREIDQIESNSLLETILAYEDLGQFWREIDSLERFQLGAKENIALLAGLQRQLASKQDESQSKINELEDYTSELDSKKAIVEANKKEKNTLLTRTKNQEAEYQRELEERIRLHNEFQKELQEFESELQFEIDISKIPSANHGVIDWPLERIEITQYFGDTAFSKANPSVYNGKGHNGIDIAALVGTDVLSARKGRVVDIGDTDIACPGVSYGKWVVVQHDNSLSTLYAHLSHIGVSPGDVVEKGSLLGYSGNTGYTTGPHLHFTLYATDGMRIIERRSRTCGTIYKTPVADFRAYLNPLLYI